MMQWFSSISWGSPENWWIFLVIGVAIVAIVRYAMWQYRVGSTLAASVTTRLLLQHFSTHKNILKAVLKIAALIFLGLGLLSPQWNEKEQMVEQEGRDLLIALDVSRSMLAQDVKPNRLALAKAKIKHLVHNLSSERVGLILFSGSSFVQCPLTSDLAAFNLFLEQVDVETISSGTTALDSAIKKALSVFERMPDRQNKLLVVITDGEDFSSNLAEIKNRAQKIGMHVIAYGVGTPEGAPIPLYDDEGNKRGHQRDDKGAIVVTRLNEGILSTLAHDSGGVYLRASSKNNRDIKKIIEFVEQFEKERFDDKKMSLLEQQYPYFIGVSLGCLLVDWLL